MAQDGQIVVGASPPKKKKTERFCFVVGPEPIRHSKKKKEKKKKLDIFVLFVFFRTPQHNVAILGHPGIPGKHDFRLKTIHFISNP